MVHGANEEEVLELEESLTARLNELVKRHVIQRYDAVSSWAPSLGRRTMLFRVVGDQGGVWLVLT